MNIKVIATASRGRGIFATESCLQGSILDKAPVIEFGERVSEIFIEDDDGEKVLAWRRDAEGEVVTTAVACSVMMLANHDDDSNAIVVRDFENGIATLQASRDIEVGEEITISYSVKKTF